MRRPRGSVSDAIKPKNRIGAGAEVAEPRLQRGTGGVCRVGLRRLRLDSKEGAQHLEERLQHLGTDITLAAPPQQPEHATVALLQHLLQQPRLAEAGAANDKGAAWRRGRRQVQKARQRGHDPAAADEGRQAATRGGIKAPGRLAATEHGARRRQLEPRTGIAGALAQFEEIGMRSQCVETGENLAGGGILRQVGRRIDDVADQIQPAAFDIACRQQQDAGMDARAHAQRQQRRRQAVVTHLPDPFMDIEGGLCGTPTVVLPQMGVAEDGESSVALRSDDAAAVFERRLMPDRAQFRQEFGEVLRLHLPSQRGRPCQIRDEDRQPMTLPVGRDSSFANLCVHRPREGRSFLDGKSTLA